MPFALTHPAPVGCGQSLGRCTCTCSHCNRAVPDCTCRCGWCSEPLHAVCRCSRPQVVVGTDEPPAAFPVFTDEYVGTTPYPPARPPGRAGGRVRAWLFGYLR